jgi:FSR family fosmidomycin resistance protein-like MFS transporter
MDRPLLLALLTAGSFPLHLLAFLLPAGGALALAAAVLAGASNMAVLPPIVITAIELAPSFVSTSSGIVMGLAWAVGALGVLAAGAVGDWLGPQLAAVVLSPIILGGSWLALRLRRRGLRAWRPVEAA